MQFHFSLSIEATPNSPKLLLRADDLVFNFTEKTVVLGFDIHKRPAHTYVHKLPVFCLRLISYSVTLVPLPFHLLSNHAPSSFPLP